LSVVKYYSWKCHIHGNDVIPTLTSKLFLCQMLFPVSAHTNCDKHQFIDYDDKHSEQ